MEPLATLEESFSDPRTGEGSSLSQCVTFLRTSIISKSVEYFTWFSDLKKPTDTVDSGQDSEGNGSQIVEQISELAACVLLPVQTLLLRGQRSQMEVGQGHRSSAEEAQGDSDTQEDADSGELQDGHLTKELLEDVQTNIKTLRVEKVN